MTTLPAAEPLHKAPLLSGVITLLYIKQLLFIMQEQRFLYHNMAFLVPKHLEYFRLRHQMVCFQHLRVDFQDFQDFVTTPPSSRYR